MFLSLERCFRCTIKTRLLRLRSRVNIWESVSYLRSEDLICTAAESNKVFANLWEPLIISDRGPSIPLGFSKAGRREIGLVCLWSHGMSREIKHHDHTYWRITFSTHKLLWYFVGKAHAKRKPKTSSIAYSVSVTPPYSHQNTEMMIVSTTWVHAARHWYLSICLKTKS